MSPMTGLTPYCGAASLRLGNVRTKDPDGGVLALFGSRRIAWSFNARVAIFAACEVLGLKPGDEILVPAYHCGSEVDPLLEAGLSVRLYPVGRDLSVNWQVVTGMVSPATRAIYVTHYFGYLQGGLTLLRQFCDTHDLRIIEDCALSLLSGSPPAGGRTGDVSVFCFYKFFPVLGGGALVVNNANLKRLPVFDERAPGRYVNRPLLRAVVKSVIGTGKLRLAIDFLRRAVRPIGSDQPAVAIPDMPPHYYFDPALKNARISRITKRVLESFSVSEAIAARRRNWARYRDLLGEAPDITLVRPSLPLEVCPLNFPVLLEHRDAVCAAMQALGIEATPWWRGFHQQLDWDSQGTAVYLKNSIMVLPLHPEMTIDHIGYVCETLHRIIDEIGSEN
jgi:dTDP-4-amino-4,6-dideoxygalactose transaminase